MSSDLPGSQPPSEPPRGGPPDGGPVEYLDSRGGDGTPPGTRGGSGRRTTVLAVAAGVGALAAGGAAWAVWSFMSTGAQPAQALPASTLGYVSVDLDPSGGQKIEALRTLKKFPAFEDEIGLDTGDDVREWIFDRLREDADCQGLDYADDVKPWLGDRFAVAAVDTGADEPAPVLVIQVSDAKAAAAGLGKVRDCFVGDSGDLAWSIDGDWALVGESQQLVDGISDEAADASLADDEDFQEWTSAAGDDGIMSMYAAPAVGALLAEDGGTDPLAPSEMTAAFEDFKGAAATIRFDDGGLELELSADPAATGRGVTAGDSGAGAISTLPDDTAAALGMSFGEGWVGELVDQAARASGDSGADLMSEMGEQLGLDLPGDLEALVGDSVALAIDADFDPSMLWSSDSGDGAGTGVGVKILGDSDRIEGVLDKLRTAAGGAEGEVLDSEGKDGVVAIGPDAGYRAVLLEDGGLGESGAFRKVVENADDAAAIFYVNFDVGDNWLAGLADDDPDVRDNLAPLQALGMSAWVDADVAHAVLKVTTD